MERHGLWRQSRAGVSAPLFVSSVIWGRFPSLRTNQVPAGNTKLNLGGSVKGLLKGLLALGFRESSPWGQEQWGVTTTCSNWREGCVKRAACRTVAQGRGMQPTLGDLAGSWRKKYLNFILLLPLGLWLMLPIDQTHLEAHAIGLPGTERVEKGKE